MGKLTPYFKIMDMELFWHEQTAWKYNLVNNNRPFTLQCYIELNDIG